ncbi:jg24718 [Pararge aegeria aegeria]|uniref:Jg24718 protein n=1 Tax=Pararge aegeria aegeria TaxID=348720 RepID=A0A8S4QE33_9NEOP|nr:jg24718 [Pararge aegeria aegeria]
MMDGIPTDSRLIVDISDGPICGYIDRQDERPQYKFKSIPYAKPPLGNLRFMIVKPSNDAEKSNLLSSLPAPPLELAFRPGGRVTTNRLT